MKKNVTILIADDSRLFRKEIIHILSSNKICKNFLEAKDGAEALKLLHQKQIDLVISDWIMPTMDGIKLLQAIRSDPNLFDIPTIFITVKNQIDEKVLGLKHGATDYISKPFHPDELITRIRNLLQTRQFQETLKQKNEELESLSVRDPLTGIYNRNYLNSALKLEWVRSQRFESQTGCLMIDIDFFKAINDTRGHKAGDEVLKEFVKIVSPLLRGYDIFCRLGG
ncbi:MAG: GGDEF domain-containing response regulator, partial [Nitrospiria bacterium]